MEIAKNTTIGKYGSTTTTTVAQDSRPDLYVVKVSEFHPRAENPDGTYGVCRNRESKIRIENGAARWETGSNFVPLDCIGNYLVDKIPGFDLVEHTRLSALEIDRVLVAYRKRMENYVPSFEELCDMRAAFGAGEQVVNIVTGVVTQL